MDGKTYFINNCNNGKVIGRGTKLYTGTGGLFGTTHPNKQPTEINIYNSYNIGTIEGGNGGGLLGKTNTASLNIHNSYNLVDMADTNAGIAHTIDKTYTTSLILTNVFYTSNSYMKTGPETVVANNVRQITLNESKTQTFVDELNSNIEAGCPYEQENEDGTTETITIDTTGWAKWVYNENLYPTLDTTTTWDATSKTWIKE